MHSTWKRIEALVEDAERKEQITEEEFQKLWDKVILSESNVINNLKF